MNQTVQLAVIIDSRFDRGFPGGLQGKIALDEDTVAAILSDGRCGGFEWLARPAHAYDLRTFCGEEFVAGATDTTARSGDNCNFTFEPSHRFLCRSRRFAGPVIPL
jgi:hypothetical protein